MSSSSSSGSHLTTSALFRAGSRGSVSEAGYPRRSRGGRGHRVPVSRCVSAAGVRFLVILCPPRSWASLAVGLPAKGRTQTGFPRSARTSCDRGGCPLYSGDHGARPDRSRSPASACRITATRPYAPPQPSIDAGLCITKHQPRVHTNSPVRSSPRLTLPDGTGASWALPRASHPALTGDARRGGDRSSSTDLKHALRHRPSLQSCVFTQCVRPRVARDNAAAGGCRSLGADPLSRGRL